MSEQMGFDDLLKFIEMKKNSPEKYQEFLKDIKGITKDMFKIAKELAEEIN